VLRDEEFIHRVKEQTALRAVLNTSQAAEGVWVVREPSGVWPGKGELNRLRLDSKKRVKNVSV